MYSILVRINALKYNVGKQFRWSRYSDNQDSNWIAHAKKNLPKLIEALEISKFSLLSDTNISIMGLGSSVS